MSSPRVASESAHPGRSDALEPSADPGQSHAPEPSAIPFQSHAPRYLDKYGAVRQGLVLALTVGALLFVTSGCGSTETPLPAGSSSESSSVEYPEDVTVPSPGKRSVRTLTGVVGPGVEAGCTAFTADNGDGLFVFVGDSAAHTQAAALEAGTKVQVTGVIRPDLMTTCQQGGAFEITALTPL